MKIRKHNARYGLVRGNPAGGFLFPWTALTLALFMLGCEKRDCCEYTVEVYVKKIYQYSYTEILCDEPKSATVHDGDTTYFKYR